MGFIPFGAVDPKELATFTKAEKTRLERLGKSTAGPGNGYFGFQASSPQTLGYGLTDSPVDQLATRSHLHQSAGAPSLDHRLEWSSEPAKSIATRLAGSFRGVVRPDTLSRADEETVSQAAKQTVRGRPMADRYFRAAALAGELHLIDLSDWDDWDSGKLQYRDEVEVSWLMRTGAGERRVIGTAPELDAAIIESAAPRGIYLYISESLLQDAQRRWHEMTQKRKR